jgi:uncharacterized protein
VHLVVLSLALVAGPATALLEVPPLSARVQDRAGLLSAGEEQSLSARLAAFESETQHQVVVLTIPSLEGEAIESFALRVAEKWKVGQAEIDNGVIVVVSSKDRRARIEVGYGLEGVLPDALSARILRDYMIPEFRHGAMGRGVERGVDAIMAAARNEALPPAPKRSARRGQSGDPNVGGFFFATIFGTIFGSGFGRKRRVLAALVGGGIAGLIGFLITQSIVVGGLALFAGGLFGFTSSGNPGSFAGPIGGRHHRGGFGGGFGGGGFGGGGFGGGGGGFGGGGASGSW